MPGVLAMKKSILSERFNQAIQLWKMFNFFLIHQVNRLLIGRRLSRIANGHSYPHDCPFTYLTQTLNTDSALFFRNGRPLVQDPIL